MLEKSYLVVVRIELSNYYCGTIASLRGTNEYGRNITEITLLYMRG